MPAGLEAGIDRKDLFGRSASPGGCGDATGRIYREVGAAFDVAPTTAGNWWRRYRRESNHAARPMGDDRRSALGARRSKLLEQAGWIGKRLAGTPELTLREVRSDLAQRGIVISYASVRRTVRKLGLLHKKKDHFRD